MKVGDILINNIRNKFLSFNIKKHKKKMQNKIFRQVIVLCYHLFLLLW